MFKNEKHFPIFKEDFIEITQTEKQVMQPNIKAEEDIIITDVKGKNILVDNQQVQ